jgi:hypothetical protein
LPFPLEDCSLYGNFVITLIIHYKIIVLENRSGNKKLDNPETSATFWQTIHRKKTNNTKKLNTRKVNPDTTVSYKTLAVLLILSSSVIEERKKTSKLK